MSPLHANHPRELTPAARAACARLVDAGIPLVSQTRAARAASTTMPRRSAALMRAFVERASSPTTCTMPTSRPAPRISASARRGTAARARRCAAASRALPAGLCARHSRRPRQGAGRRAAARSRDGPGADPGADPSAWTVEDFRGQRHAYRIPSPPIPPTPTRADRHPAVIDPQISLAPDFGAHDRSRSPPHLLAAFRRSDAARRVAAGAGPAARAGRRPDGAAPGRRPRAPATPRPRRLHRAAPAPDRRNPHRPPPSLPRTNASPRRAPS